MLEVMNMWGAVWSYNSGPISTLGVTHAGYWSNKARHLESALHSFGRTLSRLSLPKTTFFALTTHSTKFRI